MEKEHKLKVVSIRLVDDPPLFSKKPLHTSADAVEVIGEELQKYDRELFCILNLRTNGQVINMNIVSTGTLNAALVHPREVFKSAILSNASGIILIHNHPSGDCQPSKADIAVTKRLIDAGEVLGISILDHIVIGGQKDYYSFMENDMLSKKNEMVPLVAEAQSDTLKSR